MNTIIAGIRALLAQIASPKTNDPFADRVRAIIGEATAEAAAAYEKASALSDLAVQVAGQAQEQRSHAGKLSALAGDLEKVIGA